VTTKLTISSVEGCNYERDEVVVLAGGSPRCFLADAGAKLLLDLNFKTLTNQICPQDVTENHKPEERFRNISKRAPTDSLSAHSQKHSKTHITRSSCFLLSLVRTFVEL